VPELEAWQKVIIAGSNGTQYLNSVHGPNYTGDQIPHPLTCQTCHGGAADHTFDTMAEAHAGMIHDPSAPGESACKVCHETETWTSACDGCHAEIAAATQNSLHTNLWGYQSAIESRCAIDFENLNATQRAGFQANCAGCHTTCGQCHVSRPTSVAGGFPFIAETSYSHRFRRTPDMTEQCTACHGSRVGDDFTGAIEGNLPDIHRENGNRCDFCHDAEELHGDSEHAGDHYLSRYDVATMPRCEECHADLPVNVPHAHHAGIAVNCGQCHHNGGSNCGNCHNGNVAFEFPYPLPVGQCQTCHSQPYKNCTNCHNLTMAGGEYEIDPSVLQLKIARNPAAFRPEYDFTVVRHVPVDPETFAEWGLNLPSYTSEPTWVYTSPHNIRRVTAQTTVGEGQSCFAACHNSQTVLLREADLYQADGVTRLPDYDANIGNVIPDAFPGE
jgi:hypothetical protein